MINCVNRNAALVLGLYAVLSFGQQPGYPEETKLRFVDHGIAPFQLGQSKTTIDQTPGKGNIVTKYGHGDSYLYFNGKQHAYLRIDFCDSTAETLVLTDAAAAPYKIDSAKRLNADFVSARKLRLGLSEKEVASIYGQPQRSKKISQHVTQWSYSADKEHDPSLRLTYDANLKFRNGKLCELELHDGD